MDTNSNSVERVIGFDSHPDSFTAAILRGPTPAAAVVEKMFNKVPMGQLQNWARKNTTTEDLFVLEAWGNSFQVVRTLAAVERKALVLESCHWGKLKEAHANHDKISAVRIGKAYLAGTAKTVWVPDPRIQERTTQMKARVRSYLSDNGVRLKSNTPLTQPAEAEKHIRQARPWSPRQCQVIEGLLMELRHAGEQRKHWRGLIAQEVLSHPELLSIVRRCGVREMVAFALGAFVGDIKRLAEPQKLVKYLGLNPAFDDSGETQWSGGVGGHGHKDLRCLLVEAAQAILRCSKSPLAQWGRKLMARKGSLNLAVCAMGPQTRRGRLVLNDGPLDRSGADRGRTQIEGRQNDKPDRNRGTQALGQNQKNFPRANLPIAQNRQRVCAGSHPEVHSQSHPRAPAHTSRRIWITLSLSPRAAACAASRRRKIPAQKSRLGPMPPQSTGGSALRLHSCRALASQPHSHLTPTGEVFEVFPLTNHIPVVRGGKVFKIARYQRSRQMARIAPHPGGWRIRSNAQSNLRTAVVFAATSRSRSACRVA